MFVSTENARNTSKINKGKMNIFKLIWEIVTFEAWGIYINLPYYTCEPFTIICLNTRFSKLRKFHAGRKLIIVLQKQIGLRKPIRKQFYFNVRIILWPCSIRPVVIETDPLLGSAWFIPYEVRNDIVLNSRTGWWKPWKPNKALCL